MEVTRAPRIGANLQTSVKQVQKLQKALQEKAKNEPSYRFYALWDKVYRSDVLHEAYRRCRTNGGTGGVDGETFETIETGGVTDWLGKLQEELREGTYRPKPLLRVWIPKGAGGLRPLSIPTIRDRVAQTAVLLVLEPIFDSDLHHYQYGFRPNVDAKMALRRVYFQVTESERSEIVDGDLADYFTTIPHGPLMKCVARRVSDRKVLGAIKRWLRCPVIERHAGREKRTTEAKDGNRGTPQGSPISPMLSNLYFRRFMLAWEKLELPRRLDAQVINYADDFVICCGKGKGLAAFGVAKGLLEKMGLTLNESKTHVANLTEEQIDFLGYTLGPQYGKDGRRYFGTRPSRKSLKRVVKRIHDETSCRWSPTSAEDRVKILNQVLRGWCNYFNQGPVGQSYRTVMRYTERRLRRWLMRKHKRRGTGYRQYPDEYLYGTLGLFKPPMSRADRSRAKAC